jgi:hypothetical protein
MKDRYLAAVGNLAEVKASVPVHPQASVEKLNP